MTTRSRQRGKAKAPTPIDPRTKVEVAAGSHMPRVKADLSTEGMLGNASLVGMYCMEAFPDYDLRQTALSLRALVNASEKGDSHLADALLISQASSLNSIYVECMKRARYNLGEYPEAVERYMRLGLKAQSQCRATLESLAKIKNPPNVAFVRQANIANGPQQVNNGAGQGGQAGSESRAQEKPSEPIELLEDKHGEWVDARAEGAASGRDTQVEAVGAVDRPAHDDRQGQVKPKRVQGRA